MADKVILKSEFSQTGWQNRITGEIVIHYGNSFPSNWKDYDIKWANHVVETIEKEKFEFELPKEPHDGQTEDPKPLPIIHNG